MCVHSSNPPARSCLGWLSQSPWRASNGISPPDSFGWHPQTTKNRKVSIEDVIHNTVDIHKFRNKDDKKPGEKEAMEDASIKNMRPSSPRSLMACLRLGIDPEEVVYRCAASRAPPPRLASHHRPVKSSRPQKLYEPSLRRLLLQQRSVDNGWSPFNKSLKKLTRCVFSTGR